MNPYEVLDVPKDADTATIKRAYRRKARKAHPDAGGSREEFQLIARAAEILEDPAAREHFDRTGETERSARVGAEEALVQIFQSILQSSDERIDLAAEAKRVVSSERSQTKIRLSEVEKRSKQAQDQLQRLDRANAERPDLLSYKIARAVIESKVEAFENDRKALEGKLLTCDEISELLKDLQYERPLPGATASVVFRTGFGFTGS